MQGGHEQSEGAGTQLGRHDSSGGQEVMGSACVCVMDVGRIKVKRSS